MTGSRALGHGLAASALAVALGAAWAGDAGQGAASPDAEAPARAVSAAVPVEAPAAPPRAAAVPLEPPAAPVETATAPLEAAPAPVEAPAAPAEATAAPVQAPAAPAEATAAPVQAPAAPAEATAAPNDEPAAPAVAAPTATPPSLGRPAGVGAPAYPAPPAAATAIAPSAPSGSTDTHTAGASAEAAAPSPPSGTSAADSPAPARDTTVATQAVQPQPAQPRASLLPLAQPLWSDLALRFPRMKPEVQRRVQQRIVEWAALTPQQRHVARENYRIAQQVSRKDVAAEWQSYQTMTPEQRSVLVSAGSTPSNTAARNAAGPTGLARVAFQPLPRRAQPAVAESGTAASPAASPSPAGGTAPSPLR